MQIIDEKSRGWAVIFIDEDHKNFVGKIRFFFSCLGVMLEVAKHLGKIYRT